MTGLASTLARAAVASGRRPGAALALAAALASPAARPALAAQPLDCRLVAVGGYTHSERSDSVNYTHRAAGGIDYRCTDGTRILADSAVVYEHSGNVQLYRNVRFEDPDTELDADTAHYFPGAGLLEAWSGVTVADKGSGAVVRGDSLRFSRASARRAMDRILVYGGEPRAVVRPVVRAPSAAADEADEASPADSAQAEPASGEPESDSVGEAAGVAEGEAGAPIEGTDTGRSRAGPDVAGDSVAVSDSLAAATPPVDEPSDPPAAAADSSSADGAREGEPPGADTLALDQSPAGDSVAVSDSVAAATPPVDGPSDPPAAAADSSSADGARQGESPGADTLALDQPPADAEDPEPLAPYEIAARRFVIDGRRLFRAGGDVVVTRDSLEARGDSLDYDQDVGAMSVFGDARVVDRGFELTAATVSVTPTGARAEEILARRDAVVVAGDVEMTAPAIRMFMNDGAVDRLVALPETPPLPGADDGPGPEEVAGVSPGDLQRARERAQAPRAAEAAPDSLAPDSVPRPRARADQFALVGDSIDVRSPGRRLETVTAVGSARAEAIGQDSAAAADSLPEIARRDWMTGDRIVASFLSPDSSADAPADSSADAATAAEPEDGPVRMETLTAIGEAKGLYRLAASDTTGGGAASGRLALHLVRGGRIVVHLDGRQVVKMEAEGPGLSGIHLEPVADTAGLPADSARAVPDTTAARAPGRPLGEARR